MDKPVGRPVAKAVEQVRATQEEHRRLSVPRDSGVRDVWSTEEEDNDDDWADFNAKEESSDNGEQVVEPTDSEPTEEIGGDLSVGHGGTPTGKESETIVASIEHADTSAEGDRDVGGAQSDGVMDEQDGGEATATHQKTDSGEAQSGASDIAEKQNREVRADQEESEQADTNTHSNAEPGVQRKPETQKEPEAQKLPEVHVDPGKPSTRPQEEHGEERAAHGQPEESSTQHQDINTEGGLEAAVEAAAVAAVAADNHTASEHRDSRPSGKRKRKAPPAKPAERLVLAEELDSNNESADSEQYVVSHISDHRMFKGISEVYVHWVGYKGQETWERESAIQETAATTLFTYWGSVGGRAAHPPYCGKPNDWGIVYAIRGHYWELCETVVPGRETAEGADNEEEDTDGHFEGDGNDKSEHAGAGKRKAGATTKKAKKRQTKSKTRKVASQTLCLWVEWLGWPKPTVVIEGALRKTHPELVKLYWDRVPGGRPLSPPKTGKV